MMNNTANIENTLKTEGVNAKGYGILSQAVMFDRSLSLPSKAIYAYLVSYTGAGRTIFPKRETILSDLKMSKNAFYRHFNALVENGYIKVSKAKGFINKNVYTICNNPPKLNCAINDADAEGLLMLDGINAQGFGFIPKLIMCDDRISVKAKGLIAFFYSLVQNGSRAFPHRSTICVFLGISKDTYYKILGELMEYNYITVRQRHNKKGQFAVNDYILNSNPQKQPHPENKDHTENSSKAGASPCPENGDNTENDLKADASPCPKNGDNTENGLKADVSPCPENGDNTEADRVLKNETLPCPENEDNNNITRYNITDNISSSNLTLSPIPYSQDEAEIRQMIYALTRYDEYSHKQDVFSRRYCKTVKALVEMLCVPFHALYGRQLVKTETLFDYLVDCIAEDIDGASLKDLICQTVWHYEICCERYSIKRPIEYLKALIWDEIKNFDL